MANFHTQMGSSQSEERTMFFTREKNDTLNQNKARGVFSRVQKNDTSNQSLPSLVPEFSPFSLRRKVKKTNISEIRVE